MVDERFFDNTLAHKVDQTSLQTLLKTATNTDNAFLRCLALLWLLRLKDLVQQNEDDRKLIHTITPLLEGMLKCEYNHMGVGAHAWLLARMRVLCNKV